MEKSALIQKLIEKNVKVRSTKGCTGDCVGSKCKCR